MGQEQTSVVEEEVSEDFKKNVVQWDAAGIFDEIAAEISKIVESDDGFKRFVAQKVQTEESQDNL